MTKVVIRARNGERVTFDVGRDIGTIGGVERFMLLKPANLPMPTRQVRRSEIRCQNSAFILK